MNIDYISEFAVLAQVGNYLEASNLLFISQSSLSKHIQAMERELDVKLFDRTTRRIALTDEGRVLLPYARKIAALKHEYTTALHQAHGIENLSIGSLPIMAPYGITAALVDFQRDNPQISVHIIEGEAHKLKGMLLREEIELAFIRDDGVTEPEFRKIPFTGDHLVAVLPQEHRLAARASIELGELATENFLLLPEGSIVHKMAVEHCIEAGYTPHITYTGERAENIIDLVARGSGVSLLMEKPTRSLVHDNVALVDIYPAVEQAVRVYTNRTVSLSDAAMHFIDYLPYRDFFKSY